jgi:2-polyprenyl-6-hydroxyphenyl methylase/3-demethylubiquinone-9 3-methyltransferase
MRKEKRMPSAGPAPTKQTVDDAEVERFGRMADEWWRPGGPYAPLHRMNPVRIAYARDQIAARFAAEPAALRPLAGLSILDVGCGGGLLSEPLTRLGAQVMGIDPSAESIAVAEVHAELGGLSIDYRATTAGALLDTGACFDAVVASEVIEHVPDQPGFVKTLAGLTRPGGILLISTLNRTARAFALAILGAEYLLRWLPRGTHDWSRFVTPAELETHAVAAGLSVIDRRGMIFDPLRGRWRLGQDLGVNYWLAAEKPAEGQA